MPLMSLRKATSTDEDRTASTVPWKYSPGLASAKLVIRGSVEFTSDGLMVIARIGAGAGELHPDGVRPADPFMTSARTACPTRRVASARPSNDPPTGPPSRRRAPVGPSRMTVASTTSPTPGASMGGLAFLRTDARALSKRKPNRGSNPVTTTLSREPLVSLRRPSVGRWPDSKSATSEAASHPLGCPSFVTSSPCMTSREDALSSESSAADGRVHRPTAPSRATTSTRNSSRSPRGTLGETLGATSVRCSAWLSDTVFEEGWSQSTRARSFEPTATSLAQVDLARVPRFDVLMEPSNPPQKETRTPSPRTPVTVAFTSSPASKFSKPRGAFTPSGLRDVAGAPSCVGRPLCVGARVALSTGRHREGARVASVQCFLWRNPRASPPRDRIAPYLRSESRRHGKINQGKPVPCAPRQTSVPRECHDGQ
eukprot:scaffold194248_cov27-Tisochrysis_lutea.AAC.2